VIGLLVGECSALFLANEEQILAGEFSGTLIGNVSPVIAKAYGRCAEFALQYIYRSKDVLDIELAGYRIIGICWFFHDAIRIPNCLFKFS
jgi:dGTPase